MSPIIGSEVQHADANQESHVASSHGEKCFECCATVGVFFPPVANQHEAAKTHDLPAQQEQNRVVGQNHGQHATREECQCGEEVRVPTVTTQILKRVNLHERRDKCDDEQNQNRESVNVLTNAKFEPTALPPVPRFDDWRHKLFFSRAIRALNPLVSGTCRQN